MLQEIYHEENIHFSVEQWIDQSVLSQCLSEQILCANDDPDLLPQYYHCKKNTFACCFFLVFLAVNLFLLCCFAIKILDFLPLRVLSENILFYSQRKSICLISLSLECARSCMNRERL